MAAAVPHPLQEYANSLVSTFQQYASMNNNLGRLTDIEHVMADTCLRINRQFRHVNEQIRQEVQSIVARSADDGGDTEGRVRANDASATRIQEGLNGLEGYVKQNLDHIIAVTKTTNQSIAVDTRAGQQILLRLQAQMLVFNAWTVAWPEAMRRSQAGSRQDHVPLPRYDASSVPTQ
ncbi:hypothetical protein OC846_003422 [Tilletia horrida]|uniref:Uncharacterized protein n=1 Tax=Tilletia horrida TaxID=155126 RepID=A0AAN6GQ47_9BASI|nr:hypothetical protein OC846_003422 [Tilletia horrida]